MSLPAPQSETPDGQSAPRAKLASRVLLNGSWKAKAMDQKAFLAITAMLNAFPQQAAADHEMLLRTYRAVLADSSSQSIIEAAERFTRGLVTGQSKTFAPSVPEFCIEVKSRQEYIDLKAKPRLPPPSYFPGPLAPFQVRQQKRLAENSHLPVLFENINFDQWRKMSAAREVPTGAKWVASLGIVYGPEPVQARKDAAA